MQRLIRNIQITDVYGPFHFEEFLMANKPTYEELEQRVQTLEGSERELVFRSKQLESLMNNNTFGIVSLDKDMRIVGCNEAFEDLFVCSK